MQFAWSWMNRVIVVIYLCIARVARYSCTALEWTHYNRHLRTWTSYKVINHGSCLITKQIAVARCIFTHRNVVNLYSIKKHFRHNSCLLSVSWHCCVSLPLPAVYQHYSLCHTLSLQPPPVLWSVLIVGPVNCPLHGQWHQRGWGVLAHSWL